MHDSVHRQNVYVCRIDESGSPLFPPPHDEVMRGVMWGNADELFSPAFWKWQACTQISLNRYQCHALGGTLTEEVAACILGGYGLPAELGLAAFDRLRSRNHLDQATPVGMLESALAEPFVFSGKTKRYRFPRQKARYLSAALHFLENFTPPNDDIALRDALLSISGIGPKTASWIVRNHRASDDVAILDVHLVRAGCMMGLFDSVVDLVRDYFPLEQLFLEFSRRIEIPASVLDALIWDYMRRIGPTSRAGSFYERPVQPALGL